MLRTKLVEVRILAELFQIPKHDDIKALHSICQKVNLKNSAVAKELEEISFHSNPEEV